MITIKALKALSVVELMQVVEDEHLTDIIKTNEAFDLANLRFVVFVDSSDGALIVEDFEQVCFEDVADTLGCSVDVVERLLVATEEIWSLNELMELFKPYDRFIDMVRRTHCTTVADLF